MREVTLVEINRCQNRDAKMVGIVFQRLHPSLLSLCFRYMGNFDDAEDVVMVSWMKVLEKIQNFNFEHPLSFYAWLKQIAVNECLGILRKRNNFHLLPLHNLPENEEPSYEAYSNLDAQLLLKLLTQLPEGYRTVFNLFAVEGYSHTQIAQMLKISESTSKSQFRKARLFLIQLISDQRIHLSTHGK